LQAVAALSVGGCLKPDPDLLGDYLDVLASRGVKTVVVVGDFVCPRSARLPRLLAEHGFAVYAVTGRRDDTHIAKLLAESGVLLDGKLLDAGHGIYLAGVGGREPLMNISGLTRLIDKEVDGHIVLASYYPPHGLFDYSRLGVHRGLLELDELLGGGVVRAVLVSRCSPPGAQAELRGISVACLPRAAAIAQRCIHIAAGRGVGLVCASSSRELHGHRRVT